MFLSILTLVFLMLVNIMVAFAEKPADPEEIGIDQKLQRLYELYRVGETVSLRPREFRFGLGAAYMVDDSDQLGVRFSSRGLTAQASLAYGITNWLEAAVNFPLQWSEQHVESRENRLLNRNIVGVGQAGLKLITTVPTDGFETTGIIGINFPTSDERFGSNAVRTSVGFNVAKVLQPAFVFGGLSWERDWKQSGDGIGYAAGLGFYLNHYLSAGLELTGVRMLNPSRGGIYDLSLIHI